MQFLVVSNYKRYKLKQVPLALSALSLNVGAIRMIT